MSDNQNRIPSFDEVMGKDTLNGKVPSFEDIMGEEPPVKKKVSGNEPKFGGIVGTYAPQSEESKIAKALQTVKSSPATEGDVAREAAYKAVTSPKLQVTQEEFDEDPVSVSRKVILSKMPSVKRYDQPKSAEQEDKIAEFSFKEGDKEIENVKKFYSDNTNGSIAHLSKITGISNPDLLYSDEFDERIKSAVKPGNETDRLAYERLQDAKKARAVVRENLEQGKPFEDMAIDYAAANSPGMAKVIQQLKTTPTVDEVMGGVTSVNRRPEEAFDEATIGRFLYDFYNSSAVRQEMEKIPGMTSKVVSGANQLIQKYPSFGKMYLGNLISQKMEDMGMNNAVLNVATKKERDKAVEALVAEDKMSPLEVQFYKDNIRNLSGLGLLRRKVTGNPIIDTPGALESAAGGAYGGFKNTIGGLYELTGLRESVLGSQGALRQDLEKTNTQVSIKPKGIVNQIAMNAGQFFGQSMSIGAGGKMINNIKLAKDPMTVMGMVGATQAYANYLPQARMMFPGNELKQKAYAFILSGIEWKTEKIFNDRKVVDGLLGKLKPSVVETIKDFTEKKISSEAARANIQSAITRALKDTPEAAKYFGKAVVQNDIEELSAELGGQVSRGIFENKPFDEWIDGEDLYETTKAATLGSPIIGSLSARADMQKNRGITAKSIYSMAQDPDYWKSQIMEGAKLDETLAAEAPDKIKNLEIAAKIVQELDATKLTEKQKVKFVITELEKQLKAEQSKDAAVQAIPKAAISELEKVQQDILDGKDDGSIEGDKSDDVNPDEKKLFDMVVSKAKEGYKETLKAAETPIEGLEYLEDKYAENPVKFREDFGNDIADKIGERTSTEKLESAIDFLIQQNPDDPAIPVLDKLISERTNPPIDQQRELDMGDEIIEYKGERYVEKDGAIQKENGDLVAMDLYEEIKREGKPVQKLDMGSEPLVEKVVTEESSNQEPPLPEGESISTYSGMTENERLQKVAEKEGRVGITDEQRLENDFADLAYKANQLTYSSKADAQSKLRQKVREENAKAGYEKYKYSGVHILKKRNIRKGSQQGKAIWKKVSSVNKDIGNQSIKKGGIILKDRSTELQNNFDELIEVAKYLEVEDANGRKMSKDQIELALQDVYDGIPSVQADNLLNVLEDAVIKDDFPVRDNFAGERVRLNDLLGVKSEIIGEPLTEDAIKDWLNDESELSPEMEELLTNEFKNTLYEQFPEIEIEGTVSEPSARTETAGDKKPKPETASIEVAKEKVTNETTKEDIKGTQPKSTEKISQPKSPTTEDSKRARTKKEIEALPEKEREAAIDDLIFGEEGEMSPEDVVNPKEAVEVPFFAKTDGTVKEVLQHLIDNKNKFSELAQQILDTADELSLAAAVEFGHTLSQGRSRYLTREDKVKMDKKDSKNATVIIHEIIHAATSKKIPTNLKNPSHGNSYGKAYHKELLNYLKDEKGNKDTKQLIRLYLKAVNELGFSKKLFEGGKSLRSEKIEGTLTHDGYGGGKIRFHSFDSDTISRLKKRLLQVGIPKEGIREESAGRSYGKSLSIDARHLSKIWGLDSFEQKDGRLSDYISFKNNYELSQKATAGNADLTVQRGAPYGLGNLDEFLAEAFSSESFQKKLASIKDDSGVSLWQKFVTTIKNLLGIETEGTLLNSVIKAGAQIISNKRDAAIQRLSELQSPSAVDLEAAKKRMRDAGFTDAEIKSEFEKRGLDYEASKEPPPAPPKQGEGKGVGDEGGRLNDKGILNKLYNAKRTPEAAKEGFKKEGLEYETKSQKEAQEVANALLDEVGIDEAVAAAEAMKFDGDVNSLIFAEALNRLREQEEKATTPEAKLEAATRFAEIGITYDKMARYGGRFNAAINYFYKKSPLGIVIMENAKRKDDFNQWSKPKDKSWKEFWSEMMKEPEFAEQVKVQVQEELKKERAAAREARIKKVDDFFDKAKEQFKGGAAYSSIIPPKIITTALEGMKQAYRAGEAVGKIIQDAIDYISTELGSQPWDKEKFRKEWEDKLKEKGSKKPLTYEELKIKVLDKFRKKLKGLTEKQKDEVIRRSHKKLIENGALDFQDLRDIISDVVGRGELTPEDAARIKELVNKTNQVEVAAEKLREERTDEAFVNFRKAEIEAGKASKELNDLFYNKPDIVKRLTSIMQLSTLGIPALINNPIYNIWNQATLRFPIGVINTLVDKSVSSIAKLFGKNFEREYNVLAGQAEFWSKLGLGSKEAISQLFTGLNRQDYLQKEVYGQQIRPVKAFRDLVAYTRGERKMTKQQALDKAIQSTVGVPAEIVARFLNIGDKPQRFAAEGSQAAAFAKELGLEGMDFKLFTEFPREEAYREYKAQGLSDEVAAQKADYIKEAIIKEGQRSTFQQDNLLNDVITRAASIFGGKDSGTANLIKTLTISPYIKIPSNAFWSFYNLLNPEVAFLQTGIHAARAKSYSNKGETTKSKLQQREARYWMAHAIVGIGMRAAIIALVKAGVFTPGSDEDDSKKERDATSYFDKPGSVRVGDMQISNRWFGQWGMMGNAIAKKYRNATPEQREKQDEFWNIAFGMMEKEGLAELQNGIFANSSSILQAIDGGSPDRYLTNTINMMANIIQPASIAQINRASLDEVPSSRGDSFLEKLDKNFAQRSAVYRKIFNVQLNSKKDIWGQPMPKGGNLLSRLFGISRIDPQLFARPIYDDYLKTSDSGFLPPAVMPLLNGKKLNTQQYDRLEQYIGSERKKLIEPYVNDMATIPGYGLYSEIKDNEVKKAALSVLYSKGRVLGVEKFYTDYPEFRPKEDDEKEEEIKAMREEMNNEF